MALNKTQPLSSDQFIPPLNDECFKVIDPCPAKVHPPFPAGICTKCQPSSATLTSQVNLFITSFLTSSTHSLI